MNTKHFSNQWFIHGLSFLLVLILSATAINAQSSNQIVLFGARTTFPTGLHPQSVIVADFNGDGKADLAVANDTAKTVSVLLGQGDGSFSAKNDFAIGYAPTFIITGDFNRDSKLDIITANSDGPATILLGAGDGTFAAPANVNAGGSVVSLTAGDFNGDGKLDFAAANYNANTISVVLGLGDGTFRPPLANPTNARPSSVMAGDFDGDGKLDLAVANYGRNDIFIYFGRGSGAFVQGPSYVVGDGPVAVVFGDFNGDSHADLATANRDDMSATVLVNDNNDLRARNSRYFTAMVDALATGDFSRDGKLDLVVLTKNGTVAILPGIGDGTLGDPIAFDAGPGASAMATGDFNGDGKPDLAVTNAGANTVSILLNQSGLAALASVSAASFDGETLAPDSIIAAFGSGLASTTQVADTLPLPTSLAGVSVKVKDATGAELLAPLYFVSPTQINYLIPTNAAPGAATVTVISGNAAVAAGLVQIAPVAPALFTANASGRGVATGLALRVKADGTQSYEPISTFDPAQSQVVALPIDLGPDAGAASDQVFLILFGTGLRHRSTLSTVSARIGGTDAPVLYAGAQGSLVGLDQVNLSLPRSLVGRGELDVVLTVEGKRANVVKVKIK
ncbi:MAG: FG-GAP-like repeat-containing protein [Acidobacteriota bacterium]